MSQRELIENAVEGRITVEEASTLLKLGPRQVHRLKRRYRADTVDWVRHGNRPEPGWRGPRRERRASPPRSDAHGE